MKKLRMLFIIILVVSVCCGCHGKNEAETSVTEEVMEDSDNESIVEETSNEDLLFSIDASEVNTIIVTDGKTGFKYNIDAKKKEDFINMLNESHWIKGESNENNSGYSYIIRLSDSAGNEFTNEPIIFYDEVTIGITDYLSQLPVFDSEGYNNLLSMFPTPHDFTNEEPIEVDLNSDGIMEKIVLEDLHNQGGDGGYQLVVYSGDKQIPLPESCTEQGFSFSVEWDGDLEKENADAISGAAIIYAETDGHPILVLKQYLQGPGGHAHCIGYGITELELKADGTWKTPVQYYLPAY